MQRRDVLAFIRTIILLGSVSILIPAADLFAQQAPVAPVPIPAGKVLIADDFSNPGSGWFAGNSQFGACGYDNGEYFTRSAPSGTGVLFCTRPEVARDFIAEVDARLPGGGEEEWASLGVRVKQVGRGQFQGYMRLSVRSASGRVRLGINTFDDGRWNPRTLAEVDDHPAVNRGSATNRLGLKVLGATFVGYVNGQEVGQVEEGTFPDGGISLEVGGPRGATTEARFDNLVVSEIGSE